MRKLSFLQSLARAFTAPATGFESVFSSATTMLGRPWRWLRPVVRRYVAFFGDGTRPRQHQVVEFLRDDHRFSQAWRKHRPKLAIHQWLTAPQVMCPVPAALHWNLPVIESAGELAEWMRLHPVELAWFADLKGLAGAQKLSHYHYRALLKNSGGMRLIEAPKPRIKKLQRLILTEILDQIPAHPAVHGFLKGHSILTFVAPHIGQRVVLRMDLQDFFPSISGARVQTFFRTAGYPESLADLLGGICTNAVPKFVLHHDPYQRPHLPQGAPTSPALANICAYRLDCRLTGLARSVDATYTRYADDLAFSGGPHFERSVGTFLIHVAAIAMEEGFAVNHRKTRVMRQGVRQHLVGLVINSRPNVTRADFDRLKATLTNCIRHGPATQNRESHPRFKEHLEGRVSFIESVNPEKAKRLRRLFQQITW